jgi:hypothetical protein
MEKGIYLGRGGVFQRNTFSVFKLRWMRCANRMICIGEIINGNKILVEKL